MISRRPERAALLLAAAAICGLPGGHAWAQALSCAIPSAIPTPRADGPSTSQPTRRIPTASYTLAISWSPQHCRGKEAEDRFQCGGDARFGFVLHGLWPDGAGKKWPQYCRPTGLVPRAVVRDMICTTPSADLIQHEWAKHGTCGWRDPAAYFGTSKPLFAKLRYPDMMALSRRDDLTVGEFRDAFARANAHLRGLKATSIRVRTTRDGWLDELWLCMSRARAYVRCQGNAAEGKGLDRPIRIWRGALGRDNPMRR